MLLNKIKVLLPVISVLFKCRHAVCLKYHNINRTLLLWNDKDWCNTVLTSGRVFNKVLSRWQKLWSMWRRKKTHTTGAACKRRQQELLGRKKLKSGPFRVRFQHSGAKITVFEQNTEIIKFWNFWVLFCNEKWAASSCKIAGKFHWPQALTENPWSE